MTHSFIAYIDESGDDGLSGNFRAPGAGGSSHWLGVGAVIWRVSRDLDAVQWAKQIAHQLPSQRRSKVLHFKNLDHSQRVMALTVMANKPLRIVSILAHKPSIEAGLYGQKNQLYHYLCRYLVERVSWLCRDLRPSVPEGNGKVKFVFARRGGMSYPQFQTYLAVLKQSAHPDMRIHWPVIDIESIEALDQPERFGL